MKTPTRGRVPRRDIADAIVKGIKMAAKDYQRMSGKLLRDGPEYWATVYVARSLWKLIGDKTVVAEGRSTDTLVEAGRKRGRPTKETEGKRYDIVLYFANGKPRAPIEIKNHQTSDALLLKDAERIVKALSKSQLLFGAIGYSRVESETKAKSGRQKVRSYADEVFEKIRAYAEPLKFVVTQTTSTTETTVTTEEKKVEKFGCLAACIMIERKQGNAQKK